MRFVKIIVIDKDHVNYEYRWIEGSYRVDVFIYDDTSYEYNTTYYINSGTHTEPTFQEFKDSVPQNQDERYTEYITKISKDED